MTLRINGTVIVGAQGPQGPQGSQGYGTTGVQGARGANGTQGDIGVQGVQGVQGYQGAAAAQTGPQGFRGVQGYGTQGAQGPQGTNGAQGPQGPQGPQGVQGAQGSCDNIGPQGPQGAQGGTNTYFVGANIIRGMVDWSDKVYNKGINLGAYNTSTTVGYSNTTACYTPFTNPVTQSGAIIPVSNNSLSTINWYTAGGTASSGSTDLSIWTNSGMCYIPTINSVLSMCTSGTNAAGFFFNMATYYNGASGTVNLGSYANQPVYFPDLDSVFYRYLSGSTTTLGYMSSAKVLGSMTLSAAVDNLCYFPAAKSMVAMNSSTSTLYFINSKYTVTNTIVVSNNPKVMCYIPPIKSMLIMCNKESVIVNADGMITSTISVGGSVSVTRANPNSNLICYIPTIDKVVILNYSNNIYTLDYLSGITTSTIDSGLVTASGIVYLPNIDKIMVLGTNSVGNAISYIKII